MWTRPLIKGLGLNDNVFILIVFYAASDSSPRNGESAREPGQRQHLQAALGNLREAAAAHGEAEGREPCHASSLATLQVSLRCPSVNQTSCAKNIIFYP